jgi:cell filamentation protein
MRNDPYLQDNCNVLKNKLGIKNPKDLNDAEYRMSSIALRELSVKPIQGDFDLRHLCKIHEHIFGDVYEWAGKPRTIPITKAEKVFGGGSVEYSRPRNLAKDTEFVCDRIKSQSWSEMTNEEQAIAFAEYMTDLWKVHPFREGNTRTVITFMCDLAESRGLAIDRTLFAQNAEYTRNALVWSADHPQYRKTEYIYKITTDAFIRGRMKQKMSAPPDPLARFQTAASLAADAEYDFNRRINAGSPNTESDYQPQ